MKSHARSRNGRVRRVAKWAGLVICVLIAWLWVASENKPVKLVDAAFGERTRTIKLGGAWSTMYLVAGFQNLPQHPTPVHAQRARTRWAIQQLETEIELYQRSWLPSLRLARSKEGSLLRLYLPLAPSLPVLLTLTTLLFWSDRRRVRPGQCAACGYDMVGLATEATCPECGTPEIAVRGDSPRTPLPEKSL